VVQNSLRNRLTIVCAVAHEGLERREHLGEQIRYRGRITDFWRGEFAGNNLMTFVDQMELAPGPASRNVVFLLMPFVFSVDLQSGASAHLRECGRMDLCVNHRPKGTEHRP
jgi:hypothetical protein